MKNAKNILVALFFVALSSTAFGQINVGGGLSYGTDIEEFGIWARGEYQLTDTWRGAATLNFFFVEDPDIPGIDANNSFFTINFDGHYIFLDDEQFQAYGLGGVNLAFFKSTASIPGTSISESFSDSEFGLNLGAGGRYKVSETVMPTAELKLVLGDASQLVIMLGALFSIGG